MSAHCLFSLLDINIYFNSYLNLIKNLSFWNKLKDKYFIFLDDVLRFLMKKALESKGKQTDVNSFGWRGGVVEWWRAANIRISSEPNSMLIHLGYWTSTTETTSTAGNDSEDCSENTYVLTTSTLAKPIKKSHIQISKSLLSWIRLNDESTHLDLKISQFKEIVFSLLMIKINFLNLCFRWNYLKLRYFSKKE